MEIDTFVNNLLKAADHEDFEKYMRTGKVPKTKEQSAKAGIQTLEQSQNARSPPRRAEESQYRSRSKSRENRGSSPAIK